MPIRPRALIPRAPHLPTLAPLPLVFLPLLIPEAQEVVERRREDSGNFARVQTWHEGFGDVCVAARLRVVGVQEGDAGPDGELGAGEVCGQFAEVLDFEGGREVRRVLGEADLFGGFATGGCEGGFGRGVCFSCMKERVSGGEVVKARRAGTSWEGGMACVCSNLLASEVVEDVTYI